MKKVFIVLAVLLCSVAIFAAENSVNLSMSYYNVEFLTSSTDDESEISKYGVGVEASYKRHIFAGLYAEAGLGWNINLFDDQDKVACNDLMPFAGLGYKYDINDRWSADFHVACGDDLLFYDKAFASSITVKTGLGLSYAFGSNWSATAKVDGTLGWSKSDKTNYARYRVLPMIGCAYNF